MSIYIVNQNQRAHPKIGSIRIDANISEDITFTNEIPKHPIEKGYSVSDAILHNPMTIRLQCIVSSSPTYMVSDPASYHGRPDSVYAQLETLAKSEQLVTVLTSIKSYSSMGIVSISIPRSSTDGLSLTFNIDLCKVKVVHSQTLTDISNLPISKTYGNNASSGSYVLTQDTRTVNIAQGDVKNETDEVVSKTFKQTRLVRNPEVTGNNFEYHPEYGMPDTLNDPLFEPSTSDSPRTIAKESAKNDMRTINSSQKNHK